MYTRRPESDILNVMLVNVHCSLVLLHLCTTRLTNQYCGGSNQEQLSKLSASAKGAHPRRHAEAIGDSWLTARLRRWRARAAEIAMRLHEQGVADDAIDAIALLIQRMRSGAPAHAQDSSPQCSRQCQRQNQCLSVYLRSNLHCHLCATRPPRRRSPCSSLSHNGRRCRRVRVRVRVWH